MRPALTILHGDCQEVIESGRVAPQSVDLIFTSPPYADRRKKNYGGVHPDRYVDWFLPRAKAFQRCLRPSGSFVLNIKEGALNGERHPYVLELVLALREQGWMWVEEYCWYKKNCYPGKWPNRFRDSWERLLHFTRNKRFKMRQEEVMVPMGSWKEARLRNTSKADRRRVESRHGNGFAKRIENWADRDMAYPTNVLYLATECGYRGHPAAFPRSPAGLVHPAVHGSGGHGSRPVCRLGHHAGGRVPPGPERDRNRRGAGILRPDGGEAGWRGLNGGARSSARPTGWWRTLPRNSGPNCPRRRSR